MTLAVTVYTKPSGCYQCDATLRHLKKENIPFGEVTIDYDDQQMMDSFEELGHSSAPIVVATTPDGDVDWSGYRPDRIDSLKQYL